MSLYNIPLKLSVTIFWVNIQQGYSHANKIDEKYNWVVTSFTLVFTFDMAVLNVIPISQNS